MAPGRANSLRGPAAEVAGWARKYPLAPRYPRADRITLHTEDGVRLAAARLAGPPGAAATAVLAHGFTNSSRDPAIHAFARRLASQLHVVVPDLRGHGRSGGRCGLGLTEHLDVEAAVRAAPAKPVVTIGVSMGGVATLRHAGLRGGVAGTVAISAPSDWEQLTPAAARIHRYVGSRSGRIALAAVCRTRVDGPVPRLDDAGGIVAAIAPAFTIVVHAGDDHFFPPVHADRLVSWAGPPKELWWLDQGGHGTDLLTTALADRLLAAVLRRVGATEAQRGDR